MGDFTHQTVPAENGSVAFVLYLYLMSAHSVPKPPSAVAVNIKTTSPGFLGDKDYLLKKIDFAGSFCMVQFTFWYQYHV